METITRGPATPPENSEVVLTPDPSTPTQSLPLQFSYPLTYQIGPAGAILTEKFLGLDRNPDYHKERLPAGSGQTTVSFTVGPLVLNSHYYLTITADTTRPDGNCPCAHADKVEYERFTIAATLPPGSTTNVPIAGGSIGPTQNTTTQNVTSSTSATDLDSEVGAFRTFGRKSNSRQSAAQPAAAANPTIPDFIGVHRTWHFTPAIPADGSFAASLTLNYSTADLPDDPNFDETKLQIVSYNPSTGAFGTYQTALDLTNKTATAQVSGLEPAYSLVFVGTSSKAMLNAPLYVTGNGFVTKASLVNMGSADAHLNVNGYSLDGTALPGSPVATTLSANAQLLSSVDSLGFSTAGIGRAGWGQAVIDGNTVSGLITLGNGTLLDAMPLSSGHSPASILTDVEFDDTYSTELHVVNPATNSRTLTIDLRGSDGTSVGTYSGRLEAKETLVNRVEDLFPSIQKPFIGYAVVSGDGDVLASALLFSYATLTAVSGHPLNAQASGGTTLYGPQLGAPGQFTRVILVNAGGIDANLTLSAHKADGSLGGTAVNRKLSSGAQLVADLAQLFGFDPAAPLAGSFSVTSDQPSVFGDLAFGDASVKQLTRASVPLATTPAKSGLLPFVENDATVATLVNIANPNNAPAAITATVFDTGGHQVGRSVVNVPSNGFSATRLTALVPAAANLAAGYLTLGSTQPVVSFGLVSPVSGSDFAAVAAQPISSAPGGGTSATPQIVVTPASFDFGPVTVGQSKTQKFTIGNSGQADLHVQSVVLSGGSGFSLPAFTATTIAPGKSVDVNVTFQPASAASISASLTIGSDDPNQSSLIVKLTGTGIAPAAPAIKVSAPNLDFGTVNVNSTKDLTLTVSNSGNAVLNVSAAFSPNPPFSVVTPAASFTVNAGSTQTVTVRFAPTVSGAQSGTLTITSNDPANRSLTYKFTGIGAVPSTSTDVVLKIDGGIFDSEVGFPGGTATAWFLNRLTPSSYPATIKSVQIFFSTRDGGLKVNAPLTIISATNATIGATTLSLTGATTDIVPATVSALDRFITYTVPPRTITSGDFVVGFMVPNAPGIYPAEQDQLTPSQARSYTSNNGATFVLLDSVSLYCWIQSRPMSPATRAFVRWCPLEESRGQHA